MKIVKYSKLKSNKYKVVFDNELEVELYDDIIVQYNLIGKKELTQKELDEILKINDNLMAYYEGLKYISKKLRSEKEVINYLKKKEYDEKIINEVVERLRKEGYLNSQLYITSFINDQVNLGLSGPLKIRRLLEELGFASELIDLELEKVKDEVWIAKATKIVDKKIKTNHKLSNLKLKEKILYDLSNLGYSKELGRSILDEWEFNDELVIDKEFAKLLTKLNKKYAGKELELQLITKMMSKGFNYNDIKECIKKTNIC